jgi:hypothetical protein
VSRTMLSFKVTFTVNDPDHLPPLPNGEARYSDDVGEDLRTWVEAAVTAWYKTRGHEYLACEPDVGG